MRDEDYNGSVRALQNLYTGGAVTSQVAISELQIEKQECELQEVRNKVAMDTVRGFGSDLHTVLLARRAAPPAVH